MEESVEDAEMNWKGKMLFKKNVHVPKRAYNDGDIVEFDFEPNSLEVSWYDVTLIGIVTGVLYEKEGIRYKIQLRDNKRNIFGDLVIPEGKISRRIENNTITIRCNLCGGRIHVDQDNAIDIENKTKGWEKFYCLGKKHHIINMCPICVEHTKMGRERETYRCPYDNCTIISEQKKEFFEKNGIKLMNEI